MQLAFSPQTTAQRSAGEKRGLERVWDWKSFLTERRLSLSPLGVWSISLSNQGCGSQGGWATSSSIKRDLSEFLGGNMASQKQQGLRSSWFWWTRWPLALSSTVGFQNNVKFHAKNAREMERWSQDWQTQILQGRGRNVMWGWATGDKTGDSFAFWRGSLHSASSWARAGWGGGVTLQDSETSPWSYCQTPELQRRVLTLSRTRWATRHYRPSPQTTCVCSAVPTAWLISLTILFLL